ncbi:MAG: GNAT family N-acetyltransferase [Defluviitaleaceae bacterium]|nr:GNAT family N-acetyltransferase [Defluviitaleaceae bacterium]
MVQILKKNENVIKYLEKTKNANLNILAFLVFDSDADVYICNDDITNGVIVGSQSRNFFYVDTHNKDFFDEFLKMIPSGHKLFSGVAQDVADSILVDKETVWQTPCKVFVHNGLMQLSPNSDFAIEKLTEADAKEVDEYYTYRSEGSVERLRKDIRLMDSACIRVDSTLAAWCLVHAEDCSMGPLYTKEEFRGRGLGLATACDVAKKMIAKGMKPHAQIASDNIASLALINKLEGMEYSHDCVWFGLEN